MLCVSVELLNFVPLGPSEHGHSSEKSLKISDVLLFLVNPPVGFDTANLH